MSGLGHLLASAARANEAPVATLGESTGMGITLEDGYGHYPGARAQALPWRMGTGISLGHEHRHFPGARAQALPWGMGTGTGISLDKPLVCLKPNSPLLSYTPLHLSSFSFPLSSSPPFLCTLHLLFSSTLSYFCLLFSLLFSSVLLSSTPVPKDT